MSLITPVALLIFNRPDTTERVFRAIAKARPSRLLVVADGARPDRPGEVEKCAAARRIVEQVDWPCQVETEFSQANLGCRVRVSSGLNWIFSQTDRAIILEDDCLPDETFFPFCQELLEKYAEDERIMMISGTNQAGTWKAAEQSYHFSYYGGIWGWASWRRAWDRYDVNMSAWNNPEVRERIRNVLADDVQYAYRANVFQTTCEGKIDTWDYQWGFARLAHAGLSVVPCTNLISNIGFRDDATHTVGADSNYANRPTQPMQFPLRFPPLVAVDRDYDRVFIGPALSASRKPNGLFSKMVCRGKRLINAAMKCQIG